MNNRKSKLPPDGVAYSVLVTSDYSKFQFVDGNREVSRLAKLKKSIKENGWYRQPILVNEFFQIIEGQHRYLVCKELELPIEYIIQPGLRAKDCAPLNTGRNNWRVKDYVHLNTIDNVDYMYFEELLHRYGFSARITMVAIGKNITGGGASQVIESGNLKCSPEEYAKGERILRWLSQFRDDVKDAEIRGHKDSIYIALIFARNSKSISVDALTERVHRNFQRYGRSVADVMDAIEKTNDIYNYRCKTENTVDLVSEYRQAVRKEKINESKATNQ